MVRRALPFLLISLGLAAASSAQVHTNTDSLERRLERTEGIERVQTLAALAEAYQRSNPPRTIVLGREGLALLRGTPNDDLLLRILHQKGRAHIWVSEFDSAIATGDQMERMARELDDRKGVGDALNLKGTARSLQGDLSEAHTLFTSALKVREEVEDAEGVANTLSNLGIVEMRLGNFDASLDYYMRSLAVWELIGDQSGLARVLTNTGNVHFDYGNLEEALHFYERALRIREEEGDQRGIAILQNNIGLIHADQGDFLRAMEAYDIALDIWEKAGDRGNLARVLSNQGTALMNLGRLDEALQVSLRALAMREDVGDDRGTAITLSSIGNIQWKMGRTSDALSSLMRSLEIAEEVGDQKLLRDIHLNLSQIYEQRGDQEAALTEYKAYKALHDSLFNEESQSTIAELQTRYQTKEQQQQIALLESERELQALWRNILLGGIAVLMVVVSLVYSRYRLKNRAHAALEKAHAELKTAQRQLVQAEKLASLGQLTAGIAHQIKNPLNFVNNFAEVSKDIAGELKERLSGSNHGVDEDAGELLDDLVSNMTTIAEQGRRADGIVKSMMDHAAGFKGSREPTELNQLVHDYIGFAYEAMKARHADFTCEIQESYDEAVGEVEVIPQEIGRVIVNVAYNAFEAMRDQSIDRDERPAPTLSLRTERAGGTVRIRIRDNGPGIRPEIGDRIFEPFFTTKPTGTDSGLGLGLSLSYDIVVGGHGGKLTFTSDGRGTEFVVELAS